MGMIISLLSRLGGIETVTSIANIGDVNISGVADTNLMAYDASAAAWVPTAYPSGVTTLAGLSDVSLSGVADTNVLTYDSSASAWIPGAASSGGAPGFYPTFRSSVYYSSPNTHHSVTTEYAPKRQLAFILFYCSEETTWTTIGTEVTTYAGGTCNFEYLIYSVGTDGEPDEILSRSGAVPVTSTGFKTATISYTMPAGWYYLAVLNDSSTNHSVRAHGTVANLIKFYGLDTTNLATKYYRLVSTATDVTIANVGNNPAVVWDTNEAPIIFLGK